jgi:hypothetical protein
MLLPLLLVGAVVGTAGSIVLLVNRRGPSELRYGLGIFAVGAIALAIAWWYFAVYDTAQGKCNRGDLGACVVWQSQQQP